MFDVFRKTADYINKTLANKEGHDATPPFFKDSCPVIFCPKSESSMDFASLLQIADENKKNVGYSSKNFLSTKVRIWPLMRVEFLTRRLLFVTEVNHCSNYACIFRFRRPKKIQSKGPFRVEFKNSWQNKRLKRN